MSRPAHVELDLERARSKFDEARAKSRQDDGICSRNLLLSAALLVSYFLVSIIAFGYIFEDWSWFQSVYFGMVTLTTVGYGDLTPSTQGGRLFSILYSVAGLGLVTFALVFIVDMVTENSRKISKAAAKLSNLKLRKKFQNSQSQDEETALKKDLDKLTGGNPTKCKLLVSALLPIAFFIGIGGVFIHLQEDIDFVSALYFATATCTTIGYGDIFPKSEAGRVFIVFYCPFAVAMVGNAMSKLSKICQKKNAHLNLISPDFSIEALASMDEDGGGSVSKYEFIKFCLIQTKQVEESTFQGMENVFDRLDTDGSGTLDLEDIQQGSEERAPSRKAPKPGDFSRVGFSPSKSPSRSSKNVPKRFKKALQLNNL